MLLHLRNHLGRYKNPDAEATLHIHSGKIWWMIRIWALELGFNANPGGSNVHPGWASEFKILPPGHLG